MKIRKSKMDMVEVQEYRGRHFPRFFFGLLNFRILRSAGVFRKKFIKNFIKLIFKKSDKKMWKFIIFVNEKIVGGMDLIKISDGVFRIGIIIFKKYWNMGIATKAIKKLSVIAKKKGAKKISGINDKNNLASINLAQKLGCEKIRETKKEIFWEKKLK